MSDPLKAGETARFECEPCVTEFEVTLEPKAIGDKSAQAAIPPMVVTHCPFCGSHDLIAH